MGSCVDNTRILTVLSQMASEGGLGDDISDIPAVGIAPEWMSEKALAIATYAAASGAYVIMGIHNPVEGSPEVTDILGTGWEAKVGGKIEFVVEPEEMVRRTLEHIDKKRAALKLPAYDPQPLWPQRRPSCARARARDPEPRGSVPKRSTERRRRSGILQ